MSDIENKEVIKLRTLANRAYPGLEKSGLCSRHHTEDDWNCTICYPDLWALITAHCDLKQKAWKDIDRLTRENESLRQALQGWVDWWNGPAQEGVSYINPPLRRTREALAGKED